MPLADDRSSVYSASTASSSSANANGEKGGNGHKRSQSLGASLGISKPSRNASRNSLASSINEPVSLWRENQRISLRAFLRVLLGDAQIAKSRAMNEFLLKDPITLYEEELNDEARRREMDHIRIEEQQKFYEIARQRARELDVYMESFRREIVEDSEYRFSKVDHSFSGVDTDICKDGLTKLFAEIREKDKLEDLSLQYKKFAEWLRIEIAATIYHIFLAEDNSPELFHQAKRIHSLIPYTILKNVIRIANPAAVMTGVLDLFLATPFGSRSLMQRILSLAINDGIKQLQKSIDSLTAKITDPVLCSKLRKYTEIDEDIREEIRRDAALDQVDLIVAILRSEKIEPELEPKQVETVFNAYVGWNNAVENVGPSEQLSTSTVLTVGGADRRYEGGRTVVRLPKTIVEAVYQTARQGHDAGYNRRGAYSIVLRSMDRPLIVRGFSQ